MITHNARKDGTNFALLIASIQLSLSKLQESKCAAMVLKMKTDSAYLRDLNFDFLGFDRMELFQPRTSWSRKTIPATPPRSALLNVRDLLLQTRNLLEVRS